MMFGERATRKRRVSKKEQGFARIGGSLVRKAFQGSFRNIEINEAV